MGRITPAQVYARACGLAPLVGEGWSAGRGDQASDISLNGPNSQQLLLRGFTDPGDGSPRIRFTGNLQQLKIPDGLPTAFTATVAWDRADAKIVADIRRRILDGPHGYTATWAAAKQQRERAIAVIEARKQLMRTIAEHLGVRAFDTANNIYGHPRRGGLLCVQGDIGRNYYNPDTGALEWAVRLTMDVAPDQAAEFARILAEGIAADEAVQL
ncbi:MULTISPECIES: hypothetical protein [unclassified Nocardia]|uniref:hypothetical protein n=1 Tax=unclassified Nocardia TaxID=2637762 RepID=UPI00278BD3D8|nr:MULTISPECIES: hypothetical protein [unclassified Nocardia]